MKNWRLIEMLTVKERMETILKTEFKVGEEFSSYIFIERSKPILKKFVQNQRQVSFFLSRHPNVIKTAKKTWRRVE